jgi:proteasome-associated ATPase
MIDQLRSVVDELNREDLSEAAKLALLKALHENPGALDLAERALLVQAADTRGAVREAQGHLQSLRDRIDKLLQPPHFPARCLGIAETEHGLEALVLCNGQPRMVSVDAAVDIAGLSVGAEVLLAQAQNRVVALARVPSPPYGEVASFERALPDSGLLVSVRGESRAVIPAADLRDRPPKEGSLIQLDEAGIFAEREIPASAGEEYLAFSTPEVRFDDIGGLDAEIERIKELILLHTRHAAVTARYGLPRSNAILLAGRMGAGKTMLAQATCRFLGELTGSGAARWYCVGPGDLKDMYYGNTEKRIKRLFAAAKAAAERDAAPLILFFDELDAYLSKRTNSQFNRIHNEVTAALLAEMDGFQKHSNVWLLGATNRLDALDAAAVRAARFGDNIITFGALRRAGAREIFRKHLPASLPVRALDAAALVESAVGVLYAPNADNKICDVQFRDGSRRAIAAKDMLSGAEIAKICRLAKERAALREIETGVTGLVLADLLLGVERFLADSAAKLRPHNVADYVDGLPQDLEIVKVEAARRIPLASACAA